MKQSLLGAFFLAFILAFVLLLFIRAERAERPDARRHDALTTPKSRP